MKKSDYKKRIKEQINFDSEFIPNFETTISILCEILEERDRVYKLYQEQGQTPVIDYTTDRKSTNPKINPLLDTWNKLNNTALTYLDKLGLTPAGLRKLQGQLQKQEKSTGFSKLQKLIEMELDEDEEREGNA